MRSVVAALLLACAACASDPPRGTMAPGESRDRNPIQDAKAGEHAVADAARGEGSAGERTDGDPVERARERQGVPRAHERVMEDTEEPTPLPSRASATNREIVTCLERSAADACEPRLIREGKAPIPRQRLDTLDNRVRSSRAGIGRSGTIDPATGVPLSR